MLDLIGNVAGMIAILINVVAVMTAITLTLRQRLIAASIIGVWIGVATAVAAAGLLAFSPKSPLPVIGILFAFPLLAAGTLYLTSPTFRVTVLSIPTPILIGLNGLRVLGVIFLGLAAVGRLSGPFPYFAGMGDIITGLLAVPLARRVFRGEAASIVSWNAFGTLDLFVAVGLGITSAQGPLQLLHVGVGSQAMQFLPFSLIPSVLVPFYLLTHTLIAIQVVARRHRHDVTNALPTS